MSTRIDELNREIERLTKEKEQLQQTSFGEESKALFEAHPVLTSFRWTHSTPFVNDGDVCSFSAHTSDVTINDFHDAGGNPPWDETTYVPDGLAEPDKWGYTRMKYVEVPNPTYDPAMAAAIGAVQEFLRGYEEGYFFSAFGDHAEVTITATGVTVEEYNHD
jgi:hypothetical protein